MNLELSSFPSEAVMRQAAGKILTYNEKSAAYGLVLTEQQAMELAETRSLSLRDSGRIEFGGGIIQKLIEGFCGSPYLSGTNYAETLNGLLELFYYFKNESYDAVSDAKLIRLMRKAFDGPCWGTLELLGGLSMEELLNPASTEQQEEEDAFA